MSAGRRPAPVPTMVPTPRPERNRPPRYRTEDAQAMNTASEPGYATLGSTSFLSNAMDRCQSS